MHFNSPNFFLWGLGILHALGAISGAPVQNETTATLVRRDNVILIPDFQGHFKFNENPDDLKPYEEATGEAFDFMAAYGWGPLREDLHRWRDICRAFPKAPILNPPPPNTEYSLWSLAIGKPTENSTPYAFIFLGKDVISKSHLKGATGWMVSSCVRVFDGKWPEYGETPLDVKVEEVTVGEGRIPRMKLVTLLQGLNSPWDLSLKVPLLAPSHFALQYVYLITLLRCYERGGFVSNGVTATFRGSLKIDHAAKTWVDAFNRQDYERLHHVELQGQSEDEVAFGPMIGKQRRVFHWAHMCPTELARSKIASNRNFHTFILHDLDGDEVLPQAVFITTDGTKKSPGWKIFPEYRHKSRIEVGTKPFLKREMVTLTKEQWGRTVPLGVSSGDVDILSEVTQKIEAPLPIPAHIAPDLMMSVVIPCLARSGHVNMDSLAAYKVWRMRNNRAPLALKQAWLTTMQKVRAQRQHMP